MLLSLIGGDVLGRMVSAFMFLSAWFLMNTAAYGHNVAFLLMVVTN